MIHQVATLIKAFHIDNGDESVEHDSVERRGRGVYPGKLAIIAQLQDSDDPRVLPFFLEMAADPREYDLARMEVLKAIPLRSYAAHERMAVGQMLIDILANDRDEDHDEVRDYAMLALASFVEVAGALDAAGEILLDPDEDEILRANALAAIRQRGPADETIRLLQNVAGDLDNDVRESAHQLLAVWGQL